jgi:hypothetical protein
VIRSYLSVSISRPGHTQLPVDTHIRNTSHPETPSLVIEGGGRSLTVICRRPYGPPRQILTRRCKDEILKCADIFPRFRSGNPLCAEIHDNVVYHFRYLNQCSHGSSYVTAPGTSPSGARKSRISIKNLCIVHSKFVPGEKLLLRFLHKGGRNLFEYPTLTSFISHKIILGCERVVDRKDALIFKSQNQSGHCVYPSLNVRS